MMVKMMFGRVHILLDRELMVRGELTEIIKNQERIIKIILEVGKHGH